MNAKTLRISLFNLQTYAVLGFEAISCREGIRPHQNRHLISSANSGRRLLRPTEAAQHLSISSMAIYHLHVVIRAAKITEFDKFLILPFLKKFC